METLKAKGIHTRRDVTRFFDAPQEQIFYAFVQAESNKQPYSVITFDLKFSFRNNMNDDVFSVYLDIRYSISKLFFRSLPCS